MEGAKSMDTTEHLALIVEDDANVRGVLTLVLESAGWDVAVAPDGAIGCELAREHHPALVVTDLRMPRMTGIELARALTEDPRGAKIPIVAITSDGQALKSAAERSGLFEAVLTKPLAVDEFLAVIRRWWTDHPAD